MTDVPMFDRRPGEGTIRSDHRQVVTAATFADARARPFRICVEPGVTYLIPIAFGGFQAARQIALSYDGVELVAEPRGAIPETIAPEDGNAVHRWLYGQDPQPSFAERVEGAMKAHELPDRATGEALVRLMDAGFPEAETARVIRETYDHAAAEQRLYRMDWGQWTNSLIASLEHQLARGIPRRMAMATLTLKGKP